jgi:hypothetical protein
MKKISRMALLTLCVGIGAAHFVKDVKALAPPNACKGTGINCATTSDGTNYWKGIDQ